MTTPSSSMTTPSPPMAFLHANPVSVVAAMASNEIDATEREARQRAIQKFLARAEISMVSQTLAPSDMIRVEGSAMIRLISRAVPYEGAGVQLDPQSDYS